MTTMETEQGGMEVEEQYTHQLHGGILRQACVNPQATAVVVVDVKEVRRAE